MLKFLELPKVKSSPKELIAADLSPPAARHLIVIPSRAEISVGIETPPFSMPMPS